MLIPLPHAAEAFGGAGMLGGLFGVAAVAVLLLSGLKPLGTGLGIAALLSVGLALLASGRLVLARRRAPAAGGGSAEATDRDALLADARRQFLRVQAAWDADDVPALRELMLPELLDEMLALRPAGCSATDVLQLEARLLSLDRLGALDVASVEFSGRWRESPHAPAVDFRELWMLARPGDGQGGWRLARHQMLM